MTVLGTIIDLILLLIIFLMFEKGRKDGFAKAIVSLLAFVIAFVIAGSLYKSAADFSYSAFVKVPVEKKTEQIILYKVGEGKKATSSQVKEAVEGAVSSLPEFLRSGLDIEENVNILTDNVLSNSGDVSKDLAVKITEYAVKPVALKALSVICYIVLFLLALIAVSILSRALKLVNKLPLLGGVNKMLGGVVGIVKGAIIVLIICWIVAALFSTDRTVLGITSEKANSSLIVKAASQINPLNTVTNSLSEIIKQG